MTPTIDSNPGASSSLPTPATLRVVSFRAATQTFFRSFHCQADRFKGVMRWLVRLVTPKGGTVLDPFAGTGTTGHAAFLEGFSAILIEREAEYRADIARRMALALAGPDERAHAIIKAKSQVEDAGPLFGAIA